MLAHSDLDNCLQDLTDAPRWLIGYSGGVDSTVLLKLLVDWRACHPGCPELHAVYINHHLQDSAAAWQVHCQAQCEALQVPFSAVDADVRSPGEAGAREARYAAFATLLCAGDVLFLAHHLDDQVETFLLRLMRGAGLQGLTAMPHSRPLARGCLVRPLLAVARADIEAFAREHALPFVQDPSNADDRIDRNFLRTQVLPQLAGRWPAYRQTVTRAAQHIAAAAAELEGRDAAVKSVYSCMGDVGVPLAALQGEGAARVLRRWLSLRGEQMPDQAQLEEFLRQLHSAARGGAPQLRTAAYTLRRFGAAVYLLPGPAVPAPAAPVSITPGERRSIAGVGSVALLAAESGALTLTAGECLQLRWRRGGESCRPARRGGATSLKKLLQEAGVPPWWRDRVPLLYRAETILAVADIAVCEPGQAGCEAGGKAGRFELIWERENAFAD